MIGSLVSGALSLLSGFGAQQSAKKQQKLQAAYEYVNKVRHEEQQAANERNKAFADAANRETQAAWNAENTARGKMLVDRYSFANLASDADAAGFNPVTFLGAVGSTYGAMQQVGWNLQQTQPFFESAFEGTTYNMSAPTAQVPSTMEVIGKGLSAGWNTYLSDQRVEQSQNFQREMLGLQMRGRTETVPGWDNSGRVVAESFFGGGNIPYRVSSGIGVSGDRMGRTPMTDLPLGLSKWKPGDVDVTNPYQSGSPVAPVADADTWAKRYGESETMETITGVKTWLDDLSWDWNRRTWALGFKQNWRELFGYPTYNDGARGLSWGKPDQSYNPGMLPGFGYRTGEQF